MQIKVMQALLYLNKLGITGSGLLEVRMAFACTAQALRSARRRNQSWPPAAPHMALAAASSPCLSPCACSRLERAQCPAPQHA